jgi:uncharacterized SAM-binding protein YcdF (DUF218 family)
VPFLFLRWAIRLTVGLVGLAVLYVGVTYAQVWLASRDDDRSASSAIIVMGAAQWNGVPSPVLRNRLDHAAELYQAGAAPMVVVTGGKQQGDAVTQGRAGYEYLRAKGIPDAAIIVEVDGTNSYQELAAAKRLVRNAGGGNDVLIVTDPYHSMRVSAIASELGMAAHVSPTASPSSPREYFRESVAVSIGRLVGYRRLSSFT